MLLSPVIPTIENLQVETFDNGSAWGEKYVTGTIDDDTRPDNSHYKIWVDLDGDGDLTNAHFAVFDITAETFAYHIPNIDQSGAVEVRIAEIDSHGYVQGSNTTTSYDLDFALNDPPEFAHKSIDYAPGSSVYGTLHLRFRDFTRGGAYTIEYDEDGDEVADMTMGGWPGSNISTGVASLGSGPKIRIVERVRIDGQMVEAGATDWVSIGAGGPGAPSSIPRFDPQGTYTHTIIGYGYVSAGDAAGSVTASQTDGDPLIYTVTETEPIGFGTDDNFYMAPPPATTTGVSIDADGHITIANPEVVKVALRESGKYTFTIAADDGGSAIDFDYRQFTIYDNWQWWITEAYQLIDDWEGEFIHSNNENEEAAKAAVDNLQAFLDDFNDLAGLGYDIVAAVWTDSVDGPVLGTVGGVLLEVVGYVASQGAEDTVAQEMIEIKEQIDLVTDRTDDWVRYTARHWEDFTELEVTEIEDMTDPAAQALRASNYFELVARSLNFDPKDYVDSVTKRVEKSFLTVCVLGRYPSGRRIPPWIGDFQRRIVIGCASECG